jgi:hypothetical protein
VVEWQFCCNLGKRQWYFGTGVDGAGGGGSYVFWLPPHRTALVSVISGSFCGESIFHCPLVQLQQKRATEPELNLYQTDPNQAPK